MTLLSRPLSLHDVRDVERLCRAVLRHADLRLPHHDEEDALAYLISAAWELSERWDPQKDRAQDKGRAELRDELKRGVSCPRRRQAQVRTGVRTGRAFPACLAPMTHVSMRFSRSRAASDGRTWDRTRDLPRVKRALSR